MEKGLRVVRGPDWKWANQDGGEGHVGTVIRTGGPMGMLGLLLADKVVDVLWDSGSRNTYRVGAEGEFDLRVLDNAPIGMRHSNITCDSCGTSGVYGMRWKCTRCYDFDLCSICYMADKHELSHPFQRFNTPSSNGFTVPKREGGSKVEAKGIYPGAKVVRGPDWEWEDQDGGKGGKVVNVMNWGTDTGRSGVSVVWSSGSKNNYRVGYKGKVDLKYVQEASGGFYYKDHLPVLGKVNEAVSSSGEFKVGDKVRVGLDVDVVKVMQEGHGGWIPNMAKHLGQVGTVHHIMDNGDVWVQYDKWTKFRFHPGALNKAQMFSVNDIVRISGDVNKVKKEQKGHGGWNGLMAVALDEVGQVKKVDGDGDVHVEVNGMTWCFNPSCCTLVRHGDQDTSNTQDDDDDGDTDLFSGLMSLFMRDLRRLGSGQDDLVKEAAEGHTQAVRDILTNFPDKVDKKSSNKTALQVASHQGHREVVLVLLTAGAKLELRDEDGDTALLYSIYGDEPEITELLLERGADRDAVNNAGYSALHLAVNKQLLKCVKALLNHKCKVNTQDSVGDTPLHDAIRKGNREIIDMIVNYPSTDFTVQNKNGFNVLHVAAKEGNNFVIEKVLRRCRQIVDIQKEDGFSALHLAALNGHKQTCDTLLTVGKADIDIRNTKKHTPLMLSVIKGHTDIIEFLVTKGADLNVEDEDGDTCLHLTLMRKSVVEKLESSPLVRAIHGQLSMSQDESKMCVATACFLAQQGASLSHMNHQGKSPLDLIDDPHIKGLIVQFSSTHSTQVQVPQRQAETTSKGGSAKAHVPSTPQPTPPKPSDSAAIERTEHISDETDADICLYFISGRCAFGEDCPNHHLLLPYVWQYKTLQRGVKWCSFSEDNVQLLEQSYSRVNTGSCSVIVEGQMFSVDLDTMTAKTDDMSIPVRRLSTVSYVSGDDHERFLTQWTWYWESDDGWVPCGQKEKQKDKRQVTKLQTELEQAYWCNSSVMTEEIIEIDSVRYEVDFANLKQRNCQSDKETRLRRRPAYMGPEDVKKAIRLHEKAKKEATTSTNIPVEWGPMGTYDMKIVNIPSSSDKFATVKDVFLMTMPNASIIYIKRVQNPSLWLTFQMKSNIMKRKYEGGTTNEKKLFHGTSPGAVDPICEQNFDWRLYGSAVGALYGNGAYFAVDASKSNHYAKPDQHGHRFMFYARVLVGKTAKGQEKLRRPPPLDPGKPNQLFDSCTDNPQKPSIFVLFDKDQYYPEFLICYKY
ncbi:E3 ubiquitin-protein ligase MIB2-like [Liolophura sinensis]|uniref:E3 ubiquitin-protein ligase MIB2-like n=1 Tax=Liolophura sinensis TaxID=3198878 RepID=UPI003158E832